LINVLEFEKFLPSKTKGRMLTLKGYTRYTFEKNDLNGVPNVFLVFSLIKVTYFVKIPLFIGYPFLFVYITKMSSIILSIVMPHNKSTLEEKWLNDKDRCYKNDR